MLIPYVIFAAFLVLYFFCLFVVARQLNAYTLPQDRFRWITWIFIAVIFVFISVSAALLAKIDWVAIWSGVLPF